MSRKKLMIAPALLLFALLTTSIAYGLWFQTLYVSGTVNTGELDWCFTLGLTSDGTGAADLNAPDMPDEVIIPAPGDKDVGRTIISLVDCHTINVTLNNTYPCYFTMVSVYMENTGTIPIIIRDVSIFDNNHNLIRNFSLPGDISGPDDILYLDLTGDGLADIEFWWRDPLAGIQLHPDDQLREVSFWIHVLQTAPEGQDMQFFVEITAVQWNEFTGELLTRPMPK